MKYLKFSPIVLALIFLSYYYFGIYQSQKQVLSSQNEQLEQSISTGQKQWETKTDEQSLVTITVTPVELGGDIKTWKFAVVFDTHSENLDQDLTKVIVLSDDKKNTYLPTAWEGSGPGGHHREGILVFNAVQPVPQSVEIKIKDVGGVAERSFRWNLE